MPLLQSSPIRVALPDRHNTIIASRNVILQLEHRRVKLLGHTNAFVGRTLVDGCGAPSSSLGGRMPVPG